MRYRVIAICGLAAILMIGACSSSTEDKPATQANTAPVSNSSNTNTAEITTGSEVAAAQPVDANAQPAAADPMHPSSMLKSRLEKMRASGPPPSTAEVEALAMKHARPAPDNSTFTSYLADAGYEIRTFKNHPQLVRVEKKTESTGKQTIKISLRDGRVLELPGQRITTLSTASAAFILENAGIAPQQPQQKAPAGTQPQKKPSGN